MKANVIIAGASKGIGLELTQWFLKNECSVIAISRSATKLKSQPNFKTIKADITGAEVIKKKGQFNNCVSNQS